MKTAKEKFEALQTVLRDTRAKLDEHESTLRVKYGRDYGMSWLSSAERRLQETLVGRYTSACDKLYDLLDVAATRNWRSGFPVNWVCEDLTWDDAIRPIGEALFVTPPTAYSAR